MEPKRLGQSVAQAGFDGIDLTVRKGGHVLPENAARELPNAVAAIRDEGLEVPMITTELLSALDSTAEPILSTAGKLSIPYYKPGYYRYELIDVRRELGRVGTEFRQLVHLAQKCRMQTGYHNHVRYVGAPVWDIVTLIEPMDPQWVGYYFDPRHAVAEGGVIGWKVALNLVSKRLKMVAIKDFYWERSAKGEWQQIECRLGDGMVDWDYFFRVLAQIGFWGPLSLHLEYAIPGRTPTEREDNTLAAAQRDLRFLQAQLDKAHREMSATAGR